MQNVIDIGPFFINCIGQHNGNISLMEWLIIQTLTFVAQLVDYFVLYKIYLQEENTILAGRK